MSKKTAILLRIAYVAIIFAPTYWIVSHSGSRPKDLARIQAPITNIIWGQPTNGMRAGILLQREFSHGIDVLCQTVIFLRSAGATNATRYYSPGYEQVFAAQLFTEEGREIGKTAFGAKLGLPVKSSGSFDEKPGGGPQRWKMLTADANSETQVAHFNICELFDVKAPGSYELKISLRIFMPIGQGKLEMLRVDCTTPLKIVCQDPRKPAENTTLNSPPAPSRP